MIEGGTRGDGRTEATFLIKMPQFVEPVAGIMAAEQSSGTFVDVPGKTDALHEYHAACVEATTRLETVTEPSLPRSKAIADADDVSRAQRSSSRSRSRTRGRPYQTS